jgi:uncharacterized protein YhjY with autotransporter beta-barrel domain
MSGLAGGDTNHWVNGGSRLFLVFAVAIGALFSLFHASDAFPQAPADWTNNCAGCHGAIPNSQTVNGASAPNIISTAVGLTQLPMPHPMAGATVGDANALASYINQQLGVNGRNVSRAVNFGGSVTVPIPNIRISTSYTGGQIIQRVRVSTSPSRGSVPVPAVGTTDVTYNHTAQNCTTDNFEVVGAGLTDTAPRFVTITVNPPAAPIANASDQTIPYSTSQSVNLISLSGGTTNSVSFVGGVPPGLSIVGNTIRYTSSPTQYVPSFSFTYSANGPCASVNRTVNITVSAPPVPTITSAAAANGRVGQAFSYLTTANNAATSYALTGTLPAGLTFNTSTGAISGTPTINGVFNVSLTATNVTGTSAAFPLTITIALDPPAITSPLAINAGSGAAISYQIVATNLTTSFGATGLPAGLTVNTATGLISGSVTVASTQTFNATISATNATATTNRALTINISLSAPAVTSAGTASGNVGQPFTYQITASDVPTSYGATGLPPGLTLDTSSGLISGTPTTAGTFNASVTATNASGTSPARPVTITIVLQPPAITSANSVSGSAGTPLTYQITASNAPASFSATGLPPGVSINTATGLISGTPTGAGTFAATVGATNASGTGTQVVNFSISNFPLPNVGGLSVSTAFNTPTSINLATAVSGNFNSVALASQPANGTATINGLVITYTPRAGFFGTDTFSYTATGPGGTTAPASITVTVGVPPVPVITNASATARFNTAVPIDVAANISGVFTSVTIATPPANGTATVSGTVITYKPNAGYFGADSFTYTVTGPGGTSAPATISITVSTDPPVAGTLNFALPLNTPTTIDLAPFITGSAISGITVVTSPAHGSVSVNGTRITYSPNKDFFGGDTFTYAAFGAAGRSPPAAVKVTVTGRPDPTKQANVTGMVAAQVESAQRFAKAQISNFQTRMESLHRVEESPPETAPAKAASMTPGEKPKANFLHDSFAAATPKGAAAAEPFPFSAEIVAMVTSRSLSVAKASEGGGGGSAGSAMAASSAPSFWVAGNANFGSREPNGNRGALDFTTNGISVGVDKRVSRELVLGLGAGFARDRTDIGSDGSRNKSSGYSFVGYASYQPGSRVYIDSLIGIGSLDFKTRRYVEAINAFAEGDRSGRQLFGSVAGGYEYRNNGVLISPYGRLDFSSDKLKDGSESGAGQYALTYFGQTASSLQGAVGVRAESLQATSFGAATPRVRLEYRREFQNARDASVGYADLAGGPRFTFKNPGVARNQLAFGFGSDFIRRDGIKIGFDYEVLHSFNRDTNQSFRLNFTKDLDGRGAPFALSALSLTPQRPMDIQIETGYNFDDNVTRSKLAADKLIDRSTSMSGGKGFVFKFDNSENEFLRKTRAIVTASAGAEKFQNYDGLSRATGGLQGEVSYRPSAEFSAPTFALTAQGNGEYFRSELRRGYRASVGLSVRGPVTDRISYLVGIAHNQRFARSSVFSGRDNAVRGTLDYALTPSEVIYVNGEYRRGHFVSSGRGALEDLAIADVFVVDDALPGFFTYRTQGNTFLSTLGYNLGFGERHSLDFSWRRVQSTPNFRPSFATTPKDYIVDQYAIVYLIRF